MRKFYLTLCCLFALAVFGGLFATDFSVAEAAATDPFVQCGNDPATPQQGCQIPHLFETARRIIQYLFAGAAVIAVGVAVYGGVLMVTSGGNESKSTAGKKALTNALVGLAIVMLAWLIVVSVFRLLRYNKSDPFQVSSVGVVATSKLAG